MADQLPCPNPTCKHLFTLAALQASATVACPRCGFRLQGRPAPPQPAQPKAAEPTAPLARPVGGTIITAQLATPEPPKPQPVLAQPVLAQPVLAQPVLAQPPRPTPAIDVDLVKAPAPLQARAVAALNPPFIAPAPGPARDAAPSTPVRPRADGIRAFLRLAIILGVVGASFCLVSGGVVAILVGFGFASFDEIITLQAFRAAGQRAASGNRQPFIGRARNLKGTDEKAFRLLLAKDVWTSDKDLRIHLGALGAWMNKQDDLWLAVAVKDYGNQKPRTAELVKAGIEKLEVHFGEGLELAAKTEPADFAGAAAQKLTFKGQLGPVTWWGECIMLSHHGFAYWIFLAGPTLEDIQPLENELNKEETGFALETDRKAWREQPPRTETFASTGNVLSLTAPEGVWEKATQANVEYETGTLLLLGRYLKERDNQKNAHLQTLTLPAQSDLKEAMSEAKKYLEKVKKEQDAAYKLGPLADAAGQSELGVVEDVGNRRGRIAEMTLSHNDIAMRYYLVAVISDADHDTVVLCDCAWKSRQIWRQDFLSLLKTLKVRSKG
jgi:DNA-directed RNA polymerase subunit RPC12/RpoP